MSVEIKEIEEINKLISSGNIQKAIIKLEEITDSKKSGNIDAVPPFSFRYNNLKFKIQAGTLSPDEIIKHQNTLVFDILTFLEQIRQNKNEENPSRDSNPAVRLNRLPAPPEKIIGRKEELLRIKAILNQSNSIVLLKGIGGIGKTTIARQYVYDNMYHYDHIVWISVLSINNDYDQFCQTTEEAIARDIELAESLNFPMISDDPSPLRASNILRKLGKLPGTNLMVIDNAGFSLENIRHELPKPPFWQILVTSRKELSGMKVARISELSSKDSLELFYQYYPDRSLKDSIQQILKKIGYHTLTVELFAKTCKTSPSTTPKKILDLIKDKGLINLDYKVFLDHPNREEKAFPYLLEIFRSISEELKEKELLIIQQFALLPPENLTWELLIKLFQVSKSERRNFENQLIGLVKKGWLNQNEAFTDTFRIHQLIQEVVRYYYPPTTIRCEKIIRGVTKLLYKTEIIDIRKFPFALFGEFLLDHVEGESPKLNELRNNLAGIYQDMGKYHEANSLLEIVLQSKKNQSNPLSPENMRIQSNMAVSFLALGKYKEAAEFLEVALKQGTKTYGELDKRVSIRRANLARAYQRMGKYEDAIQLLSLSIEADKNNFGNSNPSLWKTQSDLAWIFRMQGKYLEAQKILEKTLEESISFFKKNDPNVASNKINLAGVYQDLGKYLEAKKLVEEAFTTCREVLGDFHPNTINALLNFVSILKTRGEFKEAKHLLLSSKKAMAAQFVDNSPFSLNIQSSLSALLKDMGKYKDAEDVLIETIILGKKIWGDNHPNVAKYKSHLAVLYKELALYKDSIQLLDSTKNSPELAGIYQDLGKFEKANKLLNVAIETDLKNFGDHHPNVIRNRLNLANVLKEEKKFDEAIVLHNLVLNNLISSLGEEHPKVAMVQAEMAEVYRELKRYDQGKMLLEKALTNTLLTFNENHPNIARIRNSFGKIFRELRQYELAIKSHKKAISSYSIIFGSEHPKVAESKLKLGGVYVLNKQKTEARTLFLNAYNIFEALFGKEHPQTISAERKLIELDKMN